MTAICSTLGLARSNVHLRATRPACWVDRRRNRAPQCDQALLGQIRAQIVHLPSYGYRRACALVNRMRRQRGLSAVNHKRVYRIMAAHGLLLMRSPRRRRSEHRHTGRVAVPRSDTRWCSDGFEIKCDSGETVTSTFIKDCADRQAIAWRAWAGKGLPAAPVQAMLVEAVERRFGSVEGIPAEHRLELLTDNGSAYIADATRQLARALGLKPVNTPVCSPQSNGMAESFVNTLRRDYIDWMDLSTAAAVLRQLPAAYEHYNRVHPHSALKMMSPIEFRHHQAQREQRPQAIYRR